MTDIIKLAVIFLVATTGGVLCLFRPQLVQTHLLQFYSKHPILSSLTLFKGFHATPYYVLVLRIVGAGALLISGASLYSVFLHLR